MKPRIVITGMGCVSGLGQGVEATWRAVVAGESGVRPVSRRLAEDADYLIEGPAAAAAPLDTSALERRLGGKALAHLDPFAAFATVATFEALEQAGLLQEAGTLSKAAIVYGAGSGGNATIEEGYLRLFERKSASVHPLSIPKSMTSAAASHLSILFGVRGAAFTIASACASSSHAIAEGMHMLRAGRAEVAIVGGSEAPITFGGWAAWGAVRAMSPTACRPFSRGRDGMILGEGAATLILERREHALARGARILGELLGAGDASDAFHITQPDGEGARSAMRNALRDADLQEAFPMLISSHGTGTPANDKTEAGALQAVFGTALERSLVIATKSAHGHLMGGAGAIEFLLGVLALQRGAAPEVQNFIGADPECDVPLALDGAKSHAFDHLLSNAFAFGGLNSVLIARRV